MKTKKIFVQCQWSGSELYSIALTTDHYESFYAWWTPSQFTPWAKRVYDSLYAKHNKFGDMERKYNGGFDDVKEDLSQDNFLCIVREQISDFLRRVAFTATDEGYSAIQVIADNYNDLMHLMSMLCKPSGESAVITEELDINFLVIPGISSEGTKEKHNALEDVKALQDSFNNNLTIVSYADNICENLTKDTGKTLTEFLTEDELEDIERADGGYEPRYSIRN